MGRIVANFFISLDGVIEAPDQWHFPYFDDEMGAVIGAGMETTDAFLMGRTLYGEWSEYWTSDEVPDGDEGFGGFINGVKKYVVSSSLSDDDVTWSNAELVPGDGAADRLREIKASTERDITMSGSATTVRWLISEGLLDELALLVHPIVVGHGEKLFDDSTGTVPLELTRQATLPTGVLHLVYTPAA